MKYFLHFSLALTLIIVFSCNNEVKEKDISKDKVNDNNLPLFSKLDSQHTGIDFNNVNEENTKYNVYEYDYYYNGGGVAIADFNNDNLQDVIFTANMSSYKLYVNKGDFKFEDISETSNINSKERGWTTGVTTLDINQDGFEDIYVCRSGWFDENQKDIISNLLFINNGDLTFTESAKEYGLDGLYYSTQACFFDFDNDGDLDLYLLNHPNVFDENGIRKGGKFLELPIEDKFSDQFYINENNKFVNVTKKHGLLNRAHGLGVLSFDYNNDGFSDIFISNDYKMPNYILENQQGKGFKDVTDGALKHMAKFSMGCDFGDINNDGYQDVFAVEMLAEDNYRKKTNMPSMNAKNYWKYVDTNKKYQDMHNSMQLNNTNGTFSEIAWLSNISETDWSWNPMFADFDNDGYQDIYVTNGFKRDINNNDYLIKAKKIAEKRTSEKKKIVFEDLVNDIPSSKVSNYVFSNNKDLTFSNKTEEWGLWNPSFSYGAAYVDLNNDGNLDIVVNNMNEEAFVFKNNGSGNKYLEFTLDNKNITAYGSKIEILDDDIYQSKELSNIHGFQSKSEDILHFGLANKNKIDSILITWFDNKQTLLLNTDVNQKIALDYKDAEFIHLSKDNNINKFFDSSINDITVSYNHEENEYDDYLKEILLPHKLSQEGPFIDVADINNDGLDDFYVGNGSGFAGKVFVQNNDGSFKKMKQPSIEKDKNSEDIGVQFFDFDSDGDQDLYVVSGSNENEMDSELYYDRLYENDGQGKFTKTKNIIPEISSSGSSISVADIDKDGDLDLFIGGFQVPGLYPNAGKSSLLINEGGKFVDKTNTLSEDLENVGMVKDAVFTDVNGDDNLDLIVVGHWMPISVFINEDGKYSNKTANYGLDNMIGWWNTIEVDDFNNDGKIDFVAGNLGLNSKHKATFKEPFKIIATDFDNNGTNDIALGYYKNGTCFPVRGRQCSSEQVPEIKEKYTTYNEFGNVTFDDLYKSFDQSNAVKIEATYFESALFINKGDSFEAIALPKEGQFAPTNAIVTLDIDNDGIKEIITSGNFYPIEVETGRYDAHIGNVFKLENGENPINLPYSETGYFIDKDSRCIKNIKIGNKEYLVISSNRNKLSFIETNSI